MIFIQALSFPSEQRVFRVLALDEDVRNHDHDKPEQGLEQACRDGFTEQWVAYCEEYGYQ